MSAPSVGSSPAPVVAAEPPKTGRMRAALAAALVPLAGYCLPRIQAIAGSALARLAPSIDFGSAKLVLAGAAAGAALASVAFMRFGKQGASTVPKEEAPPAAAAAEEKEESETAEEPSVYRLLGNEDGLVSSEGLRRDIAVLTRVAKEMEQAEQENEAGGCCSGRKRKGNLNADQLSRIAAATACMEEVRTILNDQGAKSGARKEVLDELWKEERKRVKLIAKAEQLTQMVATGLAEVNSLKPELAARVLSVAQASLPKELVRECQAIETKAIYRGAAAARPRVTVLPEPQRRARGAAAADSLEDLLED